MVEPWVLVRALDAMDVVTLRVTPGQCARAATCVSCVGRRCRATDVRAAERLDAGRATMNHDERGGTESRDTAEPIRERGARSSLDSGLPRRRGCAYVVVARSRANGAPRSVGRRLRLPRKARVENACRKRGVSKPRPEPWAWPPTFYSCTDGSVDAYVT